MHAVVVGGGIGGLGAAAGLHRSAGPSPSSEQAEEFGDVGAGISLWPNALRCLDELGVDLGEHLAAQHEGGFRDRRGRRITRFDAAAFERRHGRPLGAIHRKDLIAAPAGRRSRRKPADRRQKSPKSAKTAWSASAAENCGPTSSSPPTASTARSATRSSRTTPNPSTAAARRSAASRTAPARG